jgi:hypothetical protein
MPSKKRAVRTKTAKQKVVRKTAKKTIKKATKKPAKKAAKMADGKGVYREMLTTVQRRLAALSESSSLRTGIRLSILEQAARQVEQSDVADLARDRWAPVIVALAHIPETAVAELDTDLTLVLEQVKAEKRKDITQFLGTIPRNRVAEWYGGLFDLWCRATVLKARYDVEFDARLANGRDTDMRVKINGRHFRLECTVLGESNEDRQSFQRYLDAKRVDRNAVWMRPGTFDPPNGRSASPYYETFRMYAKVYDKIAGNLDPKRSQCADDEPNVLLVSLSGAFVHPDEPGWGWALDELLDDQPNMGGRIIPPADLTDISLGAWIDFTASELLKHGVISTDEYDARMNDWTNIIAAPRRLGGILLFKDCTLKTARVNYNSHEACSITHAEMAELERVFRTPCGYA